MSELKLIDVTKIIPNPEQPRKEFVQAELESLANSMSSPVGLIQPITVESVAGPDEIYMLVDGERRWRASQLLGWDQIPAVIRPATNHNGSERLIAAFVANEQRADLNNLERARSYQKIFEVLGSSREVARITGKSENTIRTYMAVLDFEPEVQDLFEKGKMLIVSSKVIAALKRLSPMRRLEVVGIASTRGVSENVLLALCAKYSKQLIIKPGPKPDVFEPVVPGKHFNALNMAPGKELGNRMMNAAEKTCQDCPLYDMANAKTCRQCALVDFLRRYQP